MGKVTRGGGEEHDRREGDRKTGSNSIQEVSRRESWGGISVSGAMEVMQIQDCWLWERFAIEF